MQVTCVNLKDEYQHAVNIVNELEVQLKSDEPVPNVALITARMLREKLEVMRPVVIHCARVTASLIDLTAAPMAEA